MAKWSCREVLGSTGLLNRDVLLREVLGSGHGVLAGMEHRGRRGLRLGAASEASLSCSVLCRSLLGSATEPSGQSLPLFLPGMGAEEAGVLLGFLAARWVSGFRTWVIWTTEVLILPCTRA